MLSHTFLSDLVLLCLSRRARAFRLRALVHACLRRWRYRAQLSLAAHLFRGTTLFAHKAHCVAVWRRHVALCRAVNTVQLGRRAAVVRAFLGVWRRAHWAATATRHRDAAAVALHTRHWRLRLVRRLAALVWLRQYVAAAAQTCAAGAARGRIAAGALNNVFIDSRCPDDSTCLLPSRVTLPVHSFTSVAAVAHRIRAALRRY